MKPILLSALLLTSCASPELLAERSLNKYANVASDPIEVSNHLTGEALESALQTIELMAELGLSPRGQSQFSQTLITGDGLFRSCLDVSGTSFVYQDGSPVFLDRIDRQLVEVSFEDELISDLRLTGAPC